MSRPLIIFGIVLIVVGLSWPWLSRLGFGRLPGDIVVERDNFRVYIPITSSIIVSLALALLFWLFRK